jgi:hypothetical protein
VSSMCGMTGARGCGSCDHCEAYKAKEAAAEAVRQAERQSIHEAKMALLKEQAAESKSLSAAARIQKAREAMCKSTPPKGHLYGPYRTCVGCGRSQ